ATPTAIMVGSGIGAELGILFKNGESLEKVQSLTHFVFDKTGTLTEGTPHVTDIVPSGGFSEHDLLSYAYNAELKSEHPLGAAIIREAEARNIPKQEVDHFGAVPGKGIMAVLEEKQVQIGIPEFIEDYAEISVEERQKFDNFSEAGKTPVFVAVDFTLAGIIAVADSIKTEASGVVEYLHSRGYSVVMLSGDREKTAEAIGSSLGIDSVYSEILPNEKAAVVKNLQEKGHTVGMVGDGINDAPALAQADIGFAVGSGTDIAIETAEVTLMRNNLNVLPAAIELSQRTMRTIKQNLFWAFGYNTLGIPVAMGVLYPFYPDILRIPFLASAAEMLAPGGFISPVLAAGAMALSSVSVVSNSLRLRRFLPK
ncbi:heavy metal translocating P-type ATPase, partial [candidate division KSB1 bacterium]